MDKLVAGLMERYRRDVPDHPATFFMLDLDESAIKLILKLTSRDAGTCRCLRYFVLFEVWFARCVVVVAAVT